MSKEGPKTIHELHKEYFKEIEEAERRLENSDVYDNRSSNRGGNRGGQQMIYVEKKNQNQNPVFQGFFFIFFYNA